MNKRKLLCGSICLCLANFAFVEAALAKNNGGNPCKALKNDPTVMLSSAAFMTAALKQKARPLSVQTELTISPGPHTKMSSAEITATIPSAAVRAQILFTAETAKIPSTVKGLQLPQRARQLEHTRENVTIRSEAITAKTKSTAKMGMMTSPAAPARIGYTVIFTDNVPCLESSTVDIEGVLTNVPNCDDTLTGGNGKDSLNGGPGDDSLYGGRSNDQCTGTADDTPGNIASCETTLP